MRKNYSKCIVHTVIYHVTIICSTFFFNFGNLTFCFFFFFFKKFGLVFYQSLPTHSAFCFLMLLMNKRWKIHKIK